MPLMLQTNKIWAYLCRLLVAYSSHRPWQMCQDVFHRWVSLTTSLIQFASMLQYRFFLENICKHLMFIGPRIILTVEEWKTNLMSLAIWFHFLCAQHVSDINISIIRSLRMCCWITTSVVLFSVRCVLEIWCGWFWVVLVLQAEAVLCWVSPRAGLDGWKI